MQRNILILLSVLTAVLIGAAVLTSRTPQVLTEEPTNPPQTELPIIDTEEVSLPETEPDDSSKPIQPSMSPSTTTESSIPESVSETKPEPETMTPVTNPVTMAWIYPSEPGCGAQKEYRDGRDIDILKPEFFTVNGGALTLLDTNNSSCNGYSKNFVADLKRHSTQQYVTVSSASAADMEIFLNNSLGTQTDIETLVNFVTENDLTGIELDFEDFGGWSQQNYNKYLSFVEELGTALHAKNKKLMLDGPAISDSIEQNWFAWKYEDFTSLPVDHIVVMAYDYQFDHGTGEPVAPLEWIKEVTAWASARYPKSRLSIGIPSYGYEGLVGKRPFIRTYDQLKNKTGFVNAARDTSSGEITWKSGNTVYFYQDMESIRQKIKAVNDAGVSSVSIWHLGGNLWFK